MSVTTYFDKIIPYLRTLIDKNKIFGQKIQLDIGINMVYTYLNKNNYTLFKIRQCHLFTIK